MGDDDKAHVKYLKLTANIMRSRIGLCHREWTTHRMYRDYEARNDTVDAIRRYWDECPNGNRTASSYSHVAAPVHYLSHVRHFPSIVSPVTQ